MDAVAFEGPTVVVAGFYQNLLDFNGGFSLAGVTNTSQAFLASFDIDTGDTVSLQRISNSTTQTEAAALAVLPNGDRVVGGFHIGATDIGGVPLSPATGLDAWWARITPAGVVVHVKQAAGPGEDRIHHIVTRQDGDYVVMGQYDGSVTVEGTSLSGSSFGMFMVRVADNSAPVWTTGITGGGGVGFLRRFALDAAGDVHFSSQVGSNGATLVAGTVVPAASSNGRAFVLSGQTGVLVRQAALDVAGINVSLNASAVTGSGRLVAIGQSGSQFANESGSVNGFPLSAQSRDQLIVRWTF
jgi:hypothetical protein